MAVEQMSPNALIVSLTHLSTCSPRNLLFDRPCHVLVGIERRSAAVTAWKRSRDVHRVECTPRNAWPRSHRWSANASQVCKLALVLALEVFAQEHPLAPLPFSGFSHSEDLASGEGVRISIALWCRENGCRLASCIGRKFGILCIGRMCLRCILQFASGESLQAWHFASGEGLQACILHREKVWKM